MESSLFPMKHIRSTIRHWWVHLLIGVLFVVVGIWVVREPAGAYLSLALLFAVSMLVSGSFQVVFSMVNRSSLRGWGWMLFMGLLELVLGVYLLGNFALTLVVLEVFVGFWMMFRAIDLILFAFKLKAEKVAHWGWLLVLGILLLIFSFFILANPIFGAFYIILWTSFSFLTAGFTYIFLSLKMRRVNKMLREEGSHDEAA